MHEKLPFSCYSRLDHLTKEKLDMAREAGCIQLRVGIESGNPDVRDKLLNKELSQEDLVEQMKLLRESKIKSLGYFIIGNPNESYSQANESFQVAKEIKLNRAAFFFLTPLHNLPIQQDVTVDYLDMDRSMGFSIGVGISHKISRFKKFLLVLLFYRANGWFLLKTLYAQLRGQGFSFLSGFPQYYRQARSDDFDLQKILL